MRLRLIGEALAALAAALLGAANRVSGVWHLTNGRPATAMLAWGLAVFLLWLARTAYGEYARDRWAYESYMRARGRSISPLRAHND